MAVMQFRTPFLLFLAMLSAIIVFVFLILALYADLIGLVIRATY